MRFLSIGVRALPSVATQGARQAWQGQHLKQGTRRCHSVVEHQDGSGSQEEAMNGWEGTGGGLVRGAPLCFETPPSAASPLPCNSTRNMARVRVAQAPARLVPAKLPGGMF